MDQLKSFAQKRQDMASYLQVQTRVLSELKGNIVLLNQPKPASGPPSPAALSSGFVSLQPVSSLGCTNTGQPQPADENNAVSSFERLLDTSDDS